jgi:hypothetical protein
MQVDFFDDGLRDDEEDMVQLFGRHEVLARMMVSN